MTHDDLARLRRLATAATPGPWFINERTGVVCHGDPNDDRDNYPLDNPEDDEYIAAFDPPTVLALLDRIAELELAALRAELGELGEGEPPAGMFDPAPATTEDA